MKAGTFNITLTEGVGYEKKMTWRSGGIVMELADHEAKLQVRHPTTTDTNLLELTVGSGITLSDLEPNITIQFTEAQVEAVGDALPQGLTVYRFILIPPVEPSFVLFKGELKVEAW